MPDPTALVRWLGQEPGLDIWLCGGGAPAGAVLGEIHRLVLKCNPAVLGTGVSLFGGYPVAPRSFTRVGTRGFASGALVEELVAAAP